MLLITAEQQKIMDKRFPAITGLSLAILMEQAACALQNFIRKNYSGRRVNIVCGRGNNGGDGYALARLLQNEYQVTIYEYRSQAKRFDITLKNRQACQNLKIPMKKASELTTEAGTLFVDAVFGTGFRLGRKIDAEFIYYSEILQKSRMLGSKVIAVDIPSGIETDTGYGIEAAIKADFTVTFAAPKLGLYLNDGIIAGGRVEVAPLSISRQLGGDEEKPRLIWLPEVNDIKALLPKRFDNSYKGTYGNAIVIAGSRSMPGAGVLATVAAWNGGVGKVWAWLPEPSIQAVVNIMPAVIASPRPDFMESENLAEEITKTIEKFFTDNNFGENNCCLIGPGMENKLELAIFLKFLLQWRGKVILDASALNIIASDVDIWLPLFRERSRRGYRTPLFTPHLGEFNLLKNSTLINCRNDDSTEGEDYAEQIADLKNAQDTIAEINALADIWQADILCKNAQSILVHSCKLFNKQVDKNTQEDKALVKIVWQANHFSNRDDPVEPEAVVTILPFGNSALAHAGSGDILAGLCCGLSAQNISSAQAAIVAAYLCGEASTEYALKGGSKRCFLWTEQLAEIRLLLSDLDNSY